MKCQQCIAYLLVLILATTVCCEGRGRHRRTELPKEQPINKYQPNPWHTSPPTPMPVLEEENGPPLQALPISWFQGQIKNYPKLFLETVGKPNVPIYVSRGVEIDQNVRRIVSGTPDGFQDYVTTILEVLPELEAIDDDEGSKGGAVGGGGGSGEKPKYTSRKSASKGARN